MTGYPGIVRRALVLLIVVLALARPERAVSEPLLQPQAESSEPQTRPQSAASEPLLRPQSAASEPVSSDVDTSIAQPDRARRVRATAAALIPGAVIRGAGHFALGDRETAYKLAYAQATGLGMILVSSASIGLSGASRYLTPPSMPVILTGSGIFLVSWLADIYGAAGLSRFAGTRRELPFLELEAGGLTLQNSALDVSGAGYLSIRHERRVIAALELVQGDAGYRRFAATGGYRLWQRPDDGSYIALSSELMSESFGDAGFRVAAAHGFIDGRMALQGVSETLGGAFATGHLGFGLERVRYDRDTDIERNFRAMFGLGMYVGSARRPGEIVLFYDQRRDDLVGGVSSESVAGFLGHFGVDGFWYFMGRYGVHARIALGQGQLYQVGVRHAL